MQNTKYNASSDIKEAAFTNKSMSAIENSTSAIPLKRAEEEFGLRELSIDEVFAVSAGFRCMM